MIKLFSFIKEVGSKCKDKKKNYGVRFLFLISIFNLMLLKEKDTEEGVQSPHASALLIIFSCMAYSRIVLLLTTGLST